MYTIAAMDLAYNIVFEDLYTNTGLTKIDAEFVKFLAEHNPELHNNFLKLRAGEFFEDKTQANLLIDTAEYLEDFTAKLFGIEAEVIALQAKHNELANLYKAKRLFVQRAAVKYCKPKQVDEIDITKVTADITNIIGEFNEVNFANHVAPLIDTPEGNEDTLTTFAQYTMWALHTPQGQQKHEHGILFKKAHKLDFENLVPLQTTQKDGVTVLKFTDAQLRTRTGFSLTDDGGTLEHALDDANYCIYCHNQSKDSCSKGLVDKEGNYKTSPTRVPQAGCPLEEKISEMNTLKARGFSVGALGMITVDNPMCAGTGHRICNDCMKSCIYQKQDPVDIPRVETRTLRDVLELPYGFEIYSLFTRWNPLNIARPIPKQDTGYKVLVAGLGPAGFTLAHHLINDGHTVVGIDGLKIEPLPQELTGDNFKPIKDINDIFEDLDERVLAGFGGVAEYGITIRWDKNFLKVIRLLLERRANFKMFGGVRYGSNITTEQVWQLGFNHLALCMGAGKPTVVNIKNTMSKGVRTASDFLMALQLTGAAKKDSIANLQLRMPVVVIGGGLTAIDSATESLAYYPVQVEKFLQRYEALVKLHGEQFVRASWSEEEAEIANEFITHAQAIRAERAKPNSNVVGLLQSWGGVKLAYRRKIQDSPAYRLNHEEVALAMEEGIEFVEIATPEEVILDKFAHANGLKVKIGDEHKVIPARTILMAAGTSPNTVAAREEPEQFSLNGKFFQQIDEDGNEVEPQWISKPDKPAVLLHKQTDGKAISFFGDLHPDYAGNVVKAMGSAKQGYPIISRVLAKQQPANDTNFITKITEQLSATVHDVIRLTPNIIEVVVKAPLAAKNFEPGQFYRLQNFEAYAPTAPDGTKLAMEGLALTGAWVDKEKGLMSTIVLEMGGSSDICAYLKKGEPVVLMGPTGTPTEIEPNETVMLVGGGLGNAVLFSIGKAFRDAGSKVLYFAGYKKAQDRYKIEEIEQASDVIIWACDEKADFKPNRPQDKAFMGGNIVQAIEAYQRGELGDKAIDIKDVDRIIAIGSDRMMAAIKMARHNQLKDFLKPTHEAIGSINSPMQCMMKEICAQCLQKHIDPDTGEEKFVYSCFNQDQCLDDVDFTHLRDRLTQNSLPEKLTKLWIDKCLAEMNIRESRVA